MRLLAVLIALILVFMIYSPVVYARQTAEHIQIVTIDPDQDQMVWNSTFNMSDPTNRNLSNYNQTIIPFMNNTSIDGIFTGTFLPPMVWKVADNTSFDNFYFMQLVRFKSSWIMSGSSVSWWRIPVLNITDWDYLTLFIYRVGNPGLLDLDASQPGVLNPASRPLLVYSENYWSEARNDTWYEQNVTTWGRDFTHYWLRVDAPIHSDETYFVGFYVDGSTTVPGIRCQFAQTDLSEDQLYESYLHFNGSYTTLECDLDISVIHQYGMGHTVSGWSVNTSDVKTLKFYSRTEENVDNGENVTFMMPFIRDITNASNAEVTIKNINGSWEHSYWVAENGPTDFTIKSLAWSEVYSNQLFSINVTFQNQSNMIFIHDIYSDNFPWWHIQYPGYNFQDIYPTYVNVSTTSWRHLVWFRPYHSLQVTDGQWVNTVLDPLYFLDGRLVDPDTLKLRVEKHSDSFVMKLINSTIDTAILVYNIADILFYDKLPDLDRETLEKYFVEGIKYLKGVAEPIFVMVGYIVEAVKWLVDAFSQLAGYVMKIISLIVFIPFFFFTCLITNGAKRFFVIISRDGPEAAADYGDSFFSNSVSLFNKSQPIMAITRRVRGGR